MMNFLQTGKALYVLGLICLAGVLVRLAAGSFYKRLIRESGNMALTKNRYLRELKQNAEDTYRLNQGMSNTHVYLERQMYSLKSWGMSVRAMDNLAGQFTLLCFLTGGAAAFLSYWYRSDNYYIVLYGTSGILTGMFTMMIDYGVNLESRKHQLLTCIQDYLENVMWPRMEREGENGYAPAAAEEEERKDRKENLSPRPVGRERRASGRRSLDQTAAARAGAVRETVSGEDRGIISKDSWVQDLNPDQKRMLGELLKEFIS